MVLLALYGWRMMRRSDLEKATVLQGLVGQRVDLRWASSANASLVACQWMRVVFLRLQEGNLVVRDRDNEERVYPIESIVEIRQGDRHWGPWAASKRTLVLWRRS